MSIGSVISNQYLIIVFSSIQRENNSLIQFRDGKYFFWRNVFEILNHVKPPIFNSHVSVPRIVWNVFSGNKIFLNCQRQTKVRFNLTINPKILNINFIRPDYVDTIYKRIIIVIVWIKDKLCCKIFGLARWIDIYMLSFEFFIKLEQFLNSSWRYWIIEML